MLRLVLATALLMAAALFACGPTETPKKCTPESCKGCCTAEDRCETGNTKAACGVGGVSCNTCRDVDFCRNGNCTDSAGCVSLGGSCTVSENCCIPYACNSGQCTGGGGGGCGAAGTNCTIGGDCCSGVCNNNTCFNNCNGVNGSCSPCCNPGLVCLGGTCQQGSGGGSGGGGGSSCVGLNGSCSSIYLCCGQYTCQQGTCRP